jgi:hypothetical protein
MAKNQLLTRRLASAQGASADEAWRHVLFYVDTAQWFGSETKTAIYLVLTRPYDATNYVYRKARIAAHFGNIALDRGWRV